jgi:hypothetical protein
MTAATDTRRKKDSDKVESFAFRPFIAPAWSMDQLRAMERAAKTYAANNASDPFAYARALAHMKRGIAEPADFGTSNPNT